jgi:hypothetical protein
VRRRGGLGRTDATEDRFAWQGTEIGEFAVTRTGAPARWRSLLAVSPARKVRNAEAELPLGGGP